MLSIIASIGLFLGAAVASNPQPPATVPGNSGATVASLILSGKQRARPAGTYSAGIADLISMLDAKVDSGVMLKYIENSPIAYNPDATELIALKEHGASTEILTAMLHHGDELRLRLAQMLGVFNPPAPAPVPAPTYDYAPEEPPPAEPYDSAGSNDVVYPATVYGFAYRWPWLCRTPVCNNYRPYRYDRGCWYRNPGEGQHVHGGVTADPPAVRTAPSIMAAPRAVSISSIAAGHPGNPSGRASGSHSSGRSGGQSGGRSR